MLFKRSRIRRGSITAMIRSLSSKLMLAFAVSALVSVIAMLAVMLKANQSLQIAHSTVLAANVLEDGLEARLDAFKFRITGNAAISESFADNVKDVLEVNAAIRAGGQQSPETLRELDNSDRLTSEYAAAFEQIVALRGPRNDLVLEMTATGRVVREKLTEIMESAYRDGDPTASVFAGRAQERLLLGRLYMERFLLNNTDEDYQTAMNAFAEAISRLDELLVELQNPIRRELANEARAGIEQFVASGGAVFDVIVRRNEHRAKMDEVGPQFIASVKFVMDSMTETQNAVATRLQRTGWALILLLAAASAMVLYFARRTSSRATTYISTSINKFVEAMTELANGKLDIDLGRPPDKGTELARMADALAIFRDNSEERIQLQQAQAEQEKEQAAAREAQIKRDEEAKREAQERSEAERLALLERLEKSVGAVVSHAARGDFSHRIDVDFEEISLRNMAGGINTLVQNVEDGLHATSQVIEALSNGDLSKLMEGNFEGAFQELQSNTNEMIGALTALIGDISHSTENLSSSSSELRDTSDALSKQAEQNAASLEETSAALEELNASIKQVSTNVKDANSNAKVASDAAQSGSVVASDAAEAMTRIADASQEIAKVVTVINDIAFQINLLALNAGVEAARAGDAGLGFSVVASEVRSLAQRAADAAKEIDEVIERSDQAVTEGVTKVTDARESLDRISDGIVGVSGLIEQINGAITEQVRGIDEINGAVSQIDRNTQKQAAAFEEVTAASSVLTNEAEGLSRSSARFNTAPVADNAQEAQVA